MASQWGVRAARGGFALAVALLFFGFIAISSSRAATTYTVDSTADQADGTPGDGVCSDGATPAHCTLRAAIDEANSNLPNSTTVVLPPGHYVLASGQLDILSGDTVAIAGTGTAANTAIDAGGGKGAPIPNPGVRVLQVGGDVTVQNVTLTGGYTPFGGGGANVDAGGALTLIDTAVTGNTVTSSSDGGGIANAGTLSLTRSLVESNLASGSGGGITNRGEATVLESTVDNNTANANGGGIESNTPPPDDFTVAQTTGSAGLTVTNSTISDNKADVNLSLGGGGGGIDVASGRADISSATIAGNGVGDASGGGGGVRAAGGADVSAMNTILALNRVRQSPDDCGGAVFDGGHNLESGTSCNFTAAGDFQNTDPLIGHLGDNGGPSKTRALLTGSPAIDAGDVTTCLANDQRGALRPPPPGSAGPTCDIGAYEANAMADLVLITKSDAPDPVTAGGTLTYTLVVANHGPDTANGVVVTDTLPAGVTLLSATATQGTCSGTTTVQCSLGSIPDDGDATITIVVRPNAAGTLTNTASVSAVITDPNSANNQKSAQTTVNAAPAAATVGGQGENNGGGAGSSVCNPSAPRSSISRLGSKATRRGVRLIGRALDLRCAGTNKAGGIRLVRISIAHLVGKKCSFMQKNGKFGKARSCKKPVYLKAHLGKVRTGKVPWTFRRNKKLPAGKYVARARAIDNTGLRETKSRRLNNRKLRVR